MIKKCKDCKHYANSNEGMRGERKVIVGSYCLKFKWNLSRTKAWEQKLSDKKVINFPTMKLIPGDCYERK